jgi:hypothetical protein
MTEAIVATEVVFESIWRDLDAVKAAFGDPCGNRTCRTATPR